eukprot:140457-Amphidinium_carterae.1
MENPQVAFFQHGLSQQNNKSHQNFFATLDNEYKFCGSDNNGYQFTVGHGSNNNADKFTDGHAPGDECCVPCCDQAPCAPCASTDELQL